MDVELSLGYNLKAELISNGRGENELIIVTVATVNIGESVNRIKKYQKRKEKHSRVLWSCCFSCLVANSVLSVK